VNVVAAIAELFAAVIREAIEAGEDKEKQEAALMSAEEKLAALRAKRKFG
jgi:hypothetical protein